MSISFEQYYIKLYPIWKYIQTKVLWQCAEDCDHLSRMMRNGQPFTELLMG